MRIRNGLISWGNPVFVAVVLGLVVVAAAAGLVRLQNHSADHFRSAALSKDLTVQAYDLMAAGWNVAQTANSGGTPGLSPEAQAQEREAALVLLDQTLANYQTKYAGKGPLEIQSLLSQYAAINADLLESVRSGNPGAAYALALDANNVMFQLLPTAAQVAGEYTARAETTKQLVTFGSLGVYAGALLVSLVALWHYRNARRRSEKLEEEREFIHRSEAHFRPLIQRSTDVFAVIAADGLVRYVSPAVERLLGYKPEELVGKTGLDMVHPDDVHQVESLRARVWDRPSYSSTAELRVLDKRGEEHAVEIVLTNNLDDPEVAGVVANMRDITERKALEEQLRRRAYHDSLTGLANRARFVDRLEHALLRAKKDDSRRPGVLFMDLDHFKNINDELGHEAGDKLLVEVSERIVRCLRGSDTAARLGGDEFAVILEDLDDLETAVSIAERIVEQVSRPFRFLDMAGSVSISVGVVVPESRFATASEVLRDADVAMYDAKEKGRGRAHVFEPEMRASVLERIRLSGELQQAIENDEFEVYYQPTVSLSDEQITGFEALARWNHPRRGIVQPVEFIALAEETGIIHQLGESILRKACQQAVSWAHEFPEAVNLTLSVNVSGKQLQRTNFPDVVASALKESALPAERLVLELTESVILLDSPEILDVLQRLRGLGVHLALDDFGTGYSSLSYLKRFPIDILKIDRTFIDGVDLGDKERLLVQTVIDIGQTLGMGIIAEGIERREQLLNLRALQCEMGQGFLFGKPVGADGTNDRLRDALEAPGAAA